MRLKQTQQSVGGEQGDVPVGDEDGAGQIQWKTVESALDSPAGSRDVVLVGDQHVGIKAGDVLGDEIAMMPDDDDQMVRVGPACCGHGVFDERTATDGVQDLGVTGPHSRSLARREDDDGGGAKCGHSRWLPGSVMSGNDLRALWNGAVGHVTRRP